MAGQDLANLPYASTVTQKSWLDYGPFSSDDDLMDIKLQFPFRTSCTLLLSSQP
mgnify:CR=1 FL=1